MSIKSQIEKLTLQQRRQLSHAFDCQIAQFVEFGDNEFIGIYLDSKRYPNLQIKEKVGVWSYGNVKRN